MSEGMRSSHYVTCTGRGGTPLAESRRLRAAATAGQAVSPPSNRRDRHRFSSLDLDEAIAETTRLHGARGVVELLVTALLDRRVRTDDEIDAYLERLKSACRQTGRFRDAIAVFERIAVLNPSRRNEVQAELALVHAHLRDAATGLALLKKAYAEQRRLSPRHRSAAFCIVAEVAATVLGDAPLARQIATLWQSTTPGYVTVRRNAVPVGAAPTFAPAPLFEAAPPAATPARTRRPRKAVATAAR